ncbi:hypothetical protein N7462_009855 [Penicillium macrosclerotiorum]|uniref:uncharacterized protein n=1 Tax=Penicillium macrosclerotiorum TaxID=303699 RepID=UPI0025476F6A|nr:uncharacterized protein N7462_009855 [Penicillium macrosclerotiorum]KAJ5668785.1 hypothetical protein N7462_009855 [Penicillium macrosclerotiorum]
MAAPDGLKNASPAGAKFEPKEQPTQFPAAKHPTPSPLPPSFSLHPISQLQGPFEESVAEASDISASEWVVELDAQTRRRDLLENDDYERLCGRKWRQRASERYHPFWKLVSQMSFGVHLLAHRLAKSEPEVMKILQGHVDELDGFLQRTTEDFLIIQLDVRTRIQYLTLPLGNLDVFDQMLEDRNFRLALVSYNDQIEHAVERFTMAITDALKDLSKGKEAMGALWYYFHRLADEGRFGTESLRAFYQAMMENLEGWILALSKLRRRGAALQKALGQLAFAVTEMQQRVGVASRKDTRSFIKMASRNPSRSRSVKQRILAKVPGTSPALSPSNKPLPRDPLAVPKARPVSRKPETTPIAEEGNEDAGSPKISSKRESIMPKVLNRAKSCGALVAEVRPNDGASPPRTPSRLTRKLSKPFLPKRSVSEKVDLRNRPSTAPGPTLKSRSASIEQLKTLWASGRPRTQQSTMKPPSGPRPQALQQSSDNSETMKDQISQFLKTDRVVEAWDNIARTTGCCGRTLAKTKEWPSSMFRAKSSDQLQVHSNDRFSGVDLERQMSWVQEPEILTTYSFKRRPETSPRIHVLSVSMSLDEELDGESGERMGRPSYDPGDFGSIITALPAVPPPTPALVPSVAT